MYKIEINILEKDLCVKLVIYKDCTEMHGQQYLKNFTVNWRDQITSAIANKHPLIPLMLRGSAAG
jgi:hypothetical protein